MNSGEYSDETLSAGVQPHAGEIRRQLARLLASDVFRFSLRLTRFLEFVVETTLAGKAGTIKAYTVAVAALGRGDDFDPQSDPIVRVEALRLRAALARYYEGPGRDDPIIIAIPRGSYVPIFHKRGHAFAPYPLNPASKEKATYGSARSAAVADLAEWTQRLDWRTAELRQLAEERAALAEEIRHALARSRRLREEFYGGGGSI